jgi:C-terminal processing protease CtpA/Prc
MLLLLSMAPTYVLAQAADTVQMAPMAVKASPLGFIGIRLSVDTGFFGMLSSQAHIKELVISEVLKDSAAERAGLVERDRILQIDGSPVTRFTISSLREIGDKEKGASIEFVVQGPDAREPRRVHVTLGVRKIPAS